ncbi:sodium-dependent transporter [Haloglomus litoreum]|uniref:sodium-dependent transporter n=1 Tax=Haloglomus litoreum TaxID=3034026 RepID=UPI0023E87037|nr:sodium-dependent transporter [Haloglomus sp. DT116]
MAEQWSSRLGFVLATVGAAVGLGNIWRFPAVVGRNGGGAYLVPYLFAAFAFAVPLLVLELGVGRDTRADVVGAFRSVRQSFVPLGWLVVGSVLLVLSYYLVLTGWVLSFALGALTGQLPAFGAYTDTWVPVAAFLVVAAMAGTVVAGGVQGGIELVSRVVMPVVFVALAALAAYALTLDGAAAGLEFFLRPRFDALGDPALWAAAVGQVFFSLSVGQGIMLTYGRYVAPETDLVRSALAITVADVGAAMLAGVLVFPVVFTFGLEPTLGTELAFTTLPTAFAAMPAGGLVAVGFFTLLFFAALSSAVALLEVGVAAGVDATGRERRPVTVGLTAGVALLGLPSALSYSPLDLAVAGAPVLDLLDETVGTLGLPVTALVIALVFGHAQDRDRLVAQLGSSRLVPVVRYAIPVVLVVVVLSRVVGGVPPAWRRLPAGGGVSAPVALVATLLLLGLVATGALAARRGRT